MKGVGNSLDFGARIYDPLTGRWLSRDAFTNKFPGWSSYCFAENNPITLIDNNGDSTVYYTEGGVKLHVSHDGLPIDAVFIIPDSKLMQFNTQLIFIKAIGLGDNNNANTELRKFGYGYDVKGIRSYFNEIKSKYKMIRNGRYYGYSKEVLSYLYLINGIIKIGNERVEGVEDWVDPKKDIDKKTGHGNPIEPNNVGTIHPHVNAGLNSASNSTYQDEPTEIIDYKIKINEIFDIVVSPKNIYLTRRSPTNVSLDEDITIDKKEPFKKN